MANVKLTQTQKILCFLCMLELGKDLPDIIKKCSPRKANGKLVVPFCVCASFDFGIDATANLLGKIMGHFALESLDPKSVSASAVLWGWREAGMSKAELILAALIAKLTKLLAIAELS